MPVQRATTKDYYKLLGVPRKASAEQIKKAYHRLAKQYHPDRNPGDKAAEARFKDIAEAYEILSSPDQRAQYDNILQYQATGFDFLERMARKARAQGGPDLRDLDLNDLLRSFREGAQRARPRSPRPGQPPPSGTKGPEAGGGLFDGFAGFGDVLDFILDRPAAGPQASARPKDPVQGEDLTFGLTVPAELARRGGRTHVSLPLEERCETCAGSGAKPGSASPSCRDCGGSGELPQSLGSFSIKRPCPTCLGRGTVVGTPCAACRGRGVRSVTRRLSVQVPAGAQEGQKIRLKGQGAPGPGTKPPGDLYLRLSIVEGAADEGAPPPAGAGEVTVEVNPVQAALGDKVLVTLPGGGKLKVAVPAGARDGATLRLRRAGPGGADVTVVIRVSSEEGLSARAKELLRQLERDEEER